MIFLIHIISLIAEAPNKEENESQPFDNLLFSCFDKKNPNFIKTVPDLLESGFDPSINLKDETILHRAISSAKNYEGCALWNDYLKALSALVCSGIDINAKYNDKTPVELAIDLFLILKWDDNRYTINELHLAQILEPFLLVGFDPYSTYKVMAYHKEKISFFDILVRYNYTAVVDLIIGDTVIPSKEPFEDWDLSTVYKMLCQGQNFRNFNLHIACSLSRLGHSALGLNKTIRNRCQGAVMILLENGFEPCGVNSNNSSRNTPLHEAAYLGNKEVIDLLIKNGALADLEAKNAEGFTPLIAAAFSHQAESFSCLVHHGANLNVTHPRLHGWSLKHYIKNGQFGKFFEDLRNVYHGRETIHLIMY